MKRSIMCRSGSYNAGGTHQGMDMTGRVWVVLAEDDPRGWSRGKKILTSPALRVEIGEEYTRIVTRNNIYICPMGEFEFTPHQHTWEREDDDHWHNDFSDTPVSDTPPSQLHPQKYDEKGEIING